MSDVNFLSKAIELAKQATDMDERRNFKEAYRLYLLALDWFMVAIKYEKNESIKAKIIKKSDEYTHRAEQIKATLDSAPGSKKKKAGEGTKTDEDSVTSGFERALTKDKSSTKVQEVSPGSGKSLTSAAPADIQQQLAELKAALKQEEDSRRILEEWINSSLKTTLEKHHSELKRISLSYEKRISDLEAQLEAEIASRKKLTIWVKDNLGATLEAEPLKEAVMTIVGKTRARATSGSSTASLKPVVQINAKKAPPPITSPRARSSSAGAEDGETQATSSTLPNSPHGSMVYTSSSSSSSHTPTPKPVIKSHVQKLAALETALWGEDDVTDYTFPPGDATIKSDKKRMEYYLHQQKQATTSYVCPTLFDKSKLFLQKGAKLVFAPLSDTDMKRDAFSFAILTHDRLFPVCPDGLIRSQVLYLVLQGLKRKLGASPNGLELPHGARNGFDPFVLNDQASDAQRVFQHIPAPSVGREVTAFQSAFGVEKVARFGQEAAGNHVFYNPNYSSPKPIKLSEMEISEINIHRRRMREYFDLYYYGSFKSTQSSSSSSAATAQNATYATSPIGSGRIIFIAFGSSVPIVMERLSEVNYRFDMTKVTLLALPYSADRLTAADTKPEDYITAYKQYASLFTPILDG